MVKKIIVSRIYAKPHVLRCERTVNMKIGDKHLKLVFTSYSIAFVIFYCDYGWNPMGLLCLDDKLKLPVSIMHAIFFHRL